MKGTLRKPRTPGGSWSYRLDLGYDDSGKRRQRQVGNFPTKRAAQAALESMTCWPPARHLRCAVEADRAGLPRRVDRHDQA